MADQYPHEGSSTSTVSGGGSESTLELNLKTLDSQIYGLHADKNMPVSAFKEKIAGQIGVPVEQQRLIFRGKVLKDDHLLSEYHLENGDTLHLVVRQASQPQSSSSSSVGDANLNNSGRGQEPGNGGLRNRVGQISHSVVLGTFNVGEQGDGVVPDLGRVIGAVLNSIGIGNQNGAQPGVQISAQVQPTQRSGAEGTRGDSGTQSHTTSQSPPGQPFSGQSLPQVVPIPLGGAIAIPSLNMPIPDSLNTLSEFMSRMELALSQHGSHSAQSPHDAVEPPTAELPSSSRGVPTPEALCIVVQHAQRLLGGPAVESLSRIAGQLEQDPRSSDPTQRSRIQTETAQVGLAMQHLGALLLELGRTMLTLRMGQSPAESSVNAGPAVYISPSGPNPIMVQPFPLQASSLFGGPAAHPSNPGTFGPVGIGNIPRHVNIHIHAGTSMAPFLSGVGTRTTVGEGSQEQVSRTVTGDSGQARALPLGSVIATAVPSQPAVVAVSGESTVGVSNPPPDSFPISAVISEVNSQIRNLVANMQDEHQSLSESSIVHEQSAVTGERKNDRSSYPSTSSSNEDSKSENSSISLGGSQQMVKSGDEVGTAGSSQNLAAPDGSSAVPLGLGLGGLQPKRRSRLSKSQSKSAGGSSTSSGQTEQPAVIGQQVLQSHETRSNANIQPPEEVSHSSRGLRNTLPAREQNFQGQFDVGDAMSQVLQNPALNGLLSGVSQQTGIGSPDALRNMLGQITQNPAMRNTVNQLAQQMDDHDLGNMFSSLGGGQGGSFDLSRMIQQMMPIVSQALGGVSTSASSTPAVRPDLTESRLRREIARVDETSQVNLQEVVQIIERRSSPGEIFNLVVRNVAPSYEGDVGSESVVNMFCSEEGLAADFVEMLREDISRRLQEETGA